jgi:hypothetical protein
VTSACAQRALTDAALCRSCPGCGAPPGMECSDLVAWEQLDLEGALARSLEALAAAEGSR